MIWKIFVNFAISKVHNMKIALVSFLFVQPFDERMEYVADIINNSGADVILFPGYAIENIKAAEKLQSKITNKNVVAVIEAREGTQSSVNDIGHYLFLLKDGVIMPMHTYQIFSRREQIVGKPYMIEALLTELETRKCFNFRGKKFRVLQCGEISILQNLKSDDYKASFRFSECPELLERFNKLLEDTHVFLNLIHTPMNGEFHLFEQRRAFLSANKRACFCTSNYEKPEECFHEWIQRAFYNGQPIEYDEDDGEYDGDTFAYRWDMYEIPD